MAWLYLFLDADSDALKVGVSDQPHVRLQQLPERINAAGSVQYRFPSWRDAHHAEVALHRLFRSFRVEKPMGQGYTEWFTKDCRDRLVAFINQHQALLGWSEEGPVRSVPCAARSRAASPRTPADREWSVAVVEDQNAEAVKVVGCFLDALRSEGLLVGLWRHKNGEENEDILVVRREAERLLRSRPEPLPPFVLATLVDWADPGMRKHAFFRRSIHSEKEKYGYVWIDLGRDSRCAPPSLREVRALVESLPRVPEEEMAAVTASLRRQERAWRRHASRDWFDF